MRRADLINRAMSAVALSAMVFAAQHAHAWQQKPYVAGDFHNHTTCSDGSTSVRELIDQSVNDYGLDWFSQSGHGGAYARDCRLDDPEYDANATAPGDLWINTLPNGAADIKGDPVMTTFATGQGAVPAMWRWQSIQEFNYPEVFKAGKDFGKVVYQGLEQIVPGHEHASTTVIAGQFPPSGLQGNADAMAQFEYLFDRADDDMSGGDGNNWTGKISNVGLVGNAAHAKAVQGVAWMQANFQIKSYNIPAHVERAGPFSPTSNRGWNVEHFRDYNNAGPDVSFGFESQPGHQAVSGRGGYSSGSTGGGTYGGTGFYAAKVGGMWDAMLGEGRNWWFFASSDWHNRGDFGPWDSATTGDFWPGEFQKTYIPAYIGDLKAQTVVNRLRRGDVYAVMGDLIDDKLYFGACVNNNCKNDAHMGDTLVVPAGSNVRVTLVVNDPAGTNHSPYSFPNPILNQVGITQPLNQPVLDHIDYITGDVTGKIDPTNTAAYTSAENASTVIDATFNAANWTADGEKRTVTKIFRNVQKSFYVRARGTNLPANTPHATDAEGNPLLDTDINNIPCNTGCPSHMPVGPTASSSVNGPYVDTDVEAWSNMWFYTNPIYIKVSGSTTQAFGNGTEIVP